MEMYKIPIGAWIEQVIEFLTDHVAFLTHIISSIIESGLDLFVEWVLFVPPWLVIIVLAISAGLLSNRRIAIGTLLGLGLIWNLGLWEATVATLALVLISTCFSVLVGVPFGILSALSPMVRKIVMPVLDFMQTMPAFVYLIPAIPFFGLGPVAAIFTTMVFAMPPAIRMTCLGIQQVPENLIEAADAFGSTTNQKLFKLQLPLAAPTIMAGINQTIMLSLSMVVIAAMIGAGGLGGEVWRAIQRLWMGRGFEAGIAVVIIAMILDRTTQNINVSKLWRKG
ncbi:proline/glycine betaine ABC transporter permease [Desulfobulbus rhabdoformis]|jgi:glycine betaine/proline transport system permease protein|uniref:ABC transporter permease n=1 Tax=Desulfobulbus rhabdoformis TaxID=34032 RepID=UPI001966C682|nr:proline/glycine betaine ABC transporter permease [Desulfobulbus rhabdoformis]MBM9616796.1 proline/glycine betaine ABC transporter permease [Desulfobulbus rhabdoformis]